MTSYRFAVKCVNISDPNITGMGMVQIDILPVNELEPVIMPRSFRTIRLFENAPVVHLLNLGAFNSTQSQIGMMDLMEI